MNAFTGKKLDRKLFLFFLISENLSPSRLLHAHTYTGLISFPFFVVVLLQGWYTAAYSRGAISELVCQR
jgi:hypothetical protein